jgi:hypothetical protein
LKGGVLGTYNIVFEPSGKETRWSGLREYNTHDLEEYNQIVRKGLGITQRSRCSIPRRDGEEI